MSNEEEYLCMAIVDKLVDPEGLSLLPDFVTPNDTSNCKTARTAQALRCPNDNCTYGGRVKYTCAYTKKDGTQVSAYLSHINKNENKYMSTDEKLTCSESAEHRQVKEFLRKFPASIEIVNHCMKCYDEISPVSFAETRNNCIEKVFEINGNKYILDVAFQINDSTSWAGYEVMKEHQCKLQKYIDIRNSEHIIFELDANKVLQWMKQIWNENMNSMSEKFCFNTFLEQFDKLSIEKAKFYDLMYPGWLCFDCMQQHLATSESENILYNTQTKYQRLYSTDQIRSLEEKFKKSISEMHDTLLRETKLYIDTRKKFHSCQYTSLTSLVTGHLYSSDSCTLRYLQKLQCESWGISCLDHFHDCITMVRNSWIPNTLESNPDYKNDDTSDYSEYLHMKTSRIQYLINELSEFEKYYSNIEKWHKLANFNMYVIKKLIRFKRHDNKKRKIEQNEINQRKKLTTISNNSRTQYIREYQESQFEKEDPNQYKRMLRWRDELIRLKKKNGKNARFQYESRLKYVVNLCPVFEHHWNKLLSDMQQLS